MRLSDTELKNLGIKHTTTRGRGRKETDAYIYKCAKCGSDKILKVLILERPIYCNACKQNVVERRKIAEKATEEDAKELEKLMGIKPVYEDRYYKASQSVRKLGDYESAISEAAKYACKYGSVPEAIAAIMLVSCGLEVIPQAKIFNNVLAAVDFLLPKHRVAIEIDGQLYHADKEKQYWRDEEIKSILGKEWEVLHIPAEPITKSPDIFRKCIIKRFK